MSFQCPHYKILVHIYFIAYHCYSYHCVNNFAILMLHLHFAKCLKVNVCHYYYFYFYNKNSYINYNYKNRIAIFILPLHLRGQYTTAALQGQICSVDCKKKTSRPWLHPSYADSAIEGYTSGRGRLCTHGPSSTRCRALLCPHYKDLPHIYLIAYQCYYYHGVDIFDYFNAAFICHEAY